MKLAKEKVDLTWLHKEEYDTLLEIWSEGRNHSGQWTSTEEEYGFRRSCYTDKGRGTTVQRIFLIVRQHDSTLQLEINNPSTGCSATALLPFSSLIPSPRQFQKLVFAQAKGDHNTLSASKTNLRIVWKEFLELLEKLPVVEHGGLHSDNSEWLE
jgi:hypothetical protein